MRALDVGDDARTAVGAGERLRVLGAVWKSWPRRRRHAIARTAVDARAKLRIRVLGACVEIKNFTVRSPRHDLVKNFRVHPTHWLISTQLGAEQGVARGAAEERGRAAQRGARHGPGASSVTPARSRTLASRSAMTACATGHGAENPPTVLRSASSAATCVEIKFYGVFVLNHRVVLHAIDAAPLDGLATHWLISTTGRDLPPISNHAGRDLRIRRGRSRASA